MPDIIPSAVQGDQSYALFSPLDVYQTEYYQKLFKKVPRASALSWLRQIEGRMSKRKTQRFTYGFYEEGQFMDASAVIQAITPSGGDFVITLSAADHQNLGSINRSFPVKNGTVLFGDGSTQGFIKSLNRATPNAHTITVTPATASDDIASVGIVGSTMVFFANAQPEGSKQTESRVETYSRLTNQMHTIRETFKVTDHEMQNAAWFPYKGKKYLWYKGVDATAERFELQTELAMLVSKQFVNVVDSDASPIQSMNGLYPQIDAGGMTMEYFGKPDQAGFDEIMLTLDNNYGDKDYYCAAGHNAMLALKDFLIEFAGDSKGNIDFSSFGAGGQGQALKLNFSSYAVGAYSFHFMQWDILSHKDTLGAPGMPFRHYVTFLPTGKAKNPNPEANTWENDYEPYIQMVTPSFGGTVNPAIVKEDYFNWETGAFAAGGPTSDEAVKLVHFLRYCSLEMRNRNKFINWKKANA